MPKESYSRMSALSEITNPLEDMLEETHYKGHLPRSLKLQIRDKSEELAARRFAPQGVKSLFWISAKAASKIMSTEEIKQEPDYIQAVIQSCSRWNESFVGRLPFFTQSNITALPAGPAIDDWVMEEQVGGIVIF